MKIRKIAALTLVCALTPIFFAQEVSAYPDIQQGQSFIFYTQGNRRYRKTAIPNAYKPVKTVELADFDGNVMSKPADIFVTRDGEICVLDTASGWVFIYDGEMSLKRILSDFHYPDGTPSPLNQPEGLFVAKTGEFYIADTQNGRVVKTTPDGEILLETVKPEVFTGIDIESFVPIRVVADETGRQSIIARNLNMGIAQFDENGGFLGYIGAPKVKVDWFTKFWRSISTQEQKARMERFVPTEYSNVAIDDSGFLYVTVANISQSEAASALWGGSGVPTSAYPIRLLNATGIDILRRNGILAPMGNLDTRSGSDQWASRIVDVAIGPSGSYTVLDLSSASLYTYSEEGVLLYAFGERGTSKNQFVTPLAVDYLGNDLLVLDSSVKAVMVFTPTEYGDIVLEAIAAEYIGEYDQAYGLWAEITRLNGNFRYAYEGLGKTAQEKGDYEQAMRYYQNAWQEKDYSIAKEKRRAQYMKTVFPIAFLTIGGFALIFYVRGRVIKFRKFFKDRGA